MLLLPLLVDAHLSVLVFQHCVTALDVQVEVVGVVDAHKDLEVSLNIDLQYAVAID
jgi:hypothetical protein